MNATDDNQLAITDLEPSEIAEVVELFKSQGRRSAAIHGHVNDGGLTDALVSEFARHGLPLPPVAERSDSISTAMRRDGVFLAIRDGLVLSACLTQFADESDVFVWRPKTHTTSRQDLYSCKVSRNPEHTLYSSVLRRSDLPSWPAPGSVDAS
jgi:hypothetical protein